VVALAGSAPAAWTRDGFLTAEPVGADALHVGPMDELGGEPGSGDWFSLTTRAWAPDPVVVRVAPGQQAGLVLVVHEVVSHDALVLPWVRVEVGEGSTVTVAEVVGGPGRSLVVPLTEIEAGPGSEVSYLHIQGLGDQAWQVARQHSTVGSDARLVSAAVALGGDYARLRTESQLAGPGARGRLLALYFGSGTQMHDFRTLQAHLVPKTTSDLLYKGVVANQARSVYSGLIRVEKGARGTNAFQTNRNLVLHEGAHADSVPNLEIEDNDVRCSHASAVGPISEDERFYLESRGVPPVVAERLIALGFARQVLEELPVPVLAPLIGELMAAKLDEAEAREERR
jgi:Fe-S cluster assembly protein SufD